MSAPAPAFNEEQYAKLLAQFKPRPIHTPEDCEKLTALLMELDDRENPTPEEQELAAVLTILIEKFEEQNYPLPEVPPHEALQAILEDRGLRHKDIAPVIGNKGLTSEILKGHKAISKTQAKKLAAFLHVQSTLYCSLKMRHKRIGHFSLNGECHEAEETVQEVLSQRSGKRRGA
ncbi:MAG: hypothetical protein IT165_15135, partial [Bryobacterales bacterium]|nr:hypothetical protein [Bryobacterales bacterium]